MKKILILLTLLFVPLVNNSFAETSRAIFAGGAYDRDHA